MSETSKPEAWRRGVHIGLHHDTHFLIPNLKNKFAFQRFETHRKPRVRGAIMHVAFGRVRRRIARLRTGFSLMRNGYSEMVSDTRSDGFSRMSRFG